MSTSSYSRASTALAAAAALLTVGLTAPPAMGASTGTSTGTRGPERTVSGFRAQSTSWPSVHQGWVLGTVPCGTSTCTAVVTSTNGGRTWSRVGAPDAPLAASGEPGVTDVRFADARHGWAFGPSLYATDDGGRHWHRAAIPGSGQQVLALAATPAAVYAAVSPCAIGEPEYQCTEPTTVWRSAVDRPGWQRVPVKLPVTFAPVISAHGRTVYVAVPGPASDLLYVTTDARHWISRPSPCVKSDDLALTDVVALPQERVALLCVGNAGFQKAVKEAYRSVDAARTTTDAGTAPLYGIASQLAATPTGTLLIASVSSASWLYLNTADQSWTTQDTEADGGTGWNDPVFTTDTTGFVVHGPAVDPQGAGALLRTDDGGVTWTAVDFGA